MCICIVDHGTHWNMLSLYTQSKIFDNRSAGKGLIPEDLYQCFPSCTALFFLLFCFYVYCTTNKWYCLPRQRVIGAAIMSSLAPPGAVNMTAFGGAGGGGAAAAITLLCCNMTLGHISSGFHPPLPSNALKDLRKRVIIGSMNTMCLSLWSVNIICRHHFDL